MKKIHYGWFICLGCFFMIFVTIGLCTSVHSVYQPYLIEQANLTQSQGSMITTVRCIFSFAAVFFVRKFHKKTGLRVGITLSVLFLAAAYIGFALCAHFEVYLVCAALLGLANGLGGTVPMSILMHRWFSSRQTLAMGICSAGSGCAALLMPPILTSIVENQGLFNAFLFEVILVFIIAVLIFLLIREEPSAKDLLPYHVPTNIVKEKRELRIHTDSVSHGVVAVVYIVALFMGAVSTPAFGHMTVLYANAGIPGENVAFGVSLMGIALIVGKCSFGVVTDRMGGRISTAVFGIFCIAGYVLCCFAGRGSIPLLYISYFFVGLGVTLATLGIPVWSRELFPAKDFEKTVQRLTLCYVGGELIFNIMPGIIADWTKTYVPAYYIFAIISVTVILLIEGVYLLQIKNQETTTIVAKSRS